MHVPLFAAFDGGYFHFLLEFSQLRASALHGTVFAVIYPE